MSIFLTEAKRSYAKWFAVITGALTFLAAWSVRLQGVWDWSDATHDLAACLALVVPITMAAASFESGLRRTASQNTRLSQSTGLKAAAVTQHFAAVVVLLVAGYVAGCSLFALIAELEGAYGAPGWVWLLASVSAVGAAAAVGYALGQVTGFRWFVPPVVALCAYLLFIPLNQAPLSNLQWPRALYLITDNSKDLFTGYLWPTLLGQVAWYLGAASAIFTGYLIVVSTAHRPRLAVALAVAIIAAVIGASTVVANRGIITIGFMRPAYSCDGDAPRICVALPFKAGLPALHARFDGLDRRLRGSRWAIPMLQQLDAGDESHLDAGANYIYMYSLAHGFAQEAEETYISTYVFPDRCLRRASYNLAIQAPSAWLAGEPNPLADVADSNKVAKSSRVFWKLSDESKRKWLRAHQAAIDNCSLKSNMLAELP